MNNRFVFQDPTGKRWFFVKQASVAAIALGFLGTVVFVYSLLLPVILKNPEPLADLKRQLRTMERAPTPSPPTKSDLALKKHLVAQRAVETEPPATAAAALPVRAAFLQDGDAAGLASFQKNGHHLTHVLIDRLQLTRLDGSLDVDLDPDGENVSVDAGCRLMLVLGNEENGVRVAEGVENLARADAGQRGRFVAALIEQLSEFHASGVVLDWDEIDHGLREELTRLVADTAAGLAEAGFETWLCVGMDEGFECFDLMQLSPLVSHFVARLDDENGGGSPGPLASPDWFEGWLRVASAYGSPGQWLASVGNFGYDWKDSGGRAEASSFADVMSRADNAGVATISVTAPAFNGHFSYYAGGENHEVWFTDATSFLNQIGALRDEDWGGFVLNRLGTEDPGIWQAVAADTSGHRARTAMAGMEKVEGGWGIPSIGTGEIVSLDTMESTGKRHFSITGDGRVTALYSDFPAQPTLFRAADGGPGKVVLTFDDGPDDAWTPQILEILEANRVKAAFFMVGREMKDHPELVRRVEAEGHEIGNHSFTHPNLAACPEARTRVELNATQRLLESLTSRSTTLFRPPYNADSRPANPGDLDAVRIAQGLGYTTVLESIDPRDWQAKDAAAILQGVVDQRQRGNIILLHDGGGDRRPTVEALPKIIAYLRERGDEIVSLADLMGVDRDTAMPPVRSDQKSLASLASAAGFPFLHAVGDMLKLFLIAATVLVALRTALVLALAFSNARRPPCAPGFARPVSVIVPAFNEGRVIEKTLESILASDYEGPLEIIVIDDGSTDDTLERAGRIDDSRVRLLGQPNSGKAHALQRGVAAASHEILVFLDADTQFERPAIRHLVAPFQDEKIGAVSGHARVGNRRTLLARCQDLEYVSGFNLDRRAYAEWNCITVVPGAISAVRRRAIEAAGGFSFDTLAEDTDLTLSIHRAGFRVAYQRRAVAHTEAPETFATLARQRFRWAYGTLQCAWKHRDLVFNPRYKALAWFSLPGIWFFQVILVAFSPLIDLLFLQSLFLGTARETLPYFLIFLGADLAMALAAVHLEGMRWRSALMIIPQRFLYRPLLSYVIWKSIVHALRGAFVGWGKLHRTATATVP